MTNYMLFSGKFEFVNKLIYDSKHFKHKNVIKSDIMGNCLNEKNEMNQDSVSLTHEQYKIIGNEHFRAKRYEEALFHYTRAIKLNSNISVYYSNRAICFYKLKNYINSFQDGHKAYKLDKFNLKAIYMCIKSKASQSLILSPKSFSYFKESLAFFHYLEILPSEKYTDPMHKLFKHLKNKILSLKPYIEKHHKRTNIENYYRLLIPRNLYSKLYNYLRTEEFRIESFICPLTLVRNI